MPPLRAVLFDLDGTLADNMHHHADAWVETSARHGIPTARDRFARDWAGKKNEELIVLLLGRAAPEAEVRALADEKEALYRARAAATLGELPGTTALLQRLRAAGFKLAVATAAPEANRALVLDGLKLRPHFDAVVGPEGLRGKPFPDIFLAAARALGVEPEACVVVEDALNGVRAGVAAQMPVAAVTTTFDEAALREAGARWVLRDFRSLPAELEQALFPPR